MWLLPLVIAPRIVQGDRMLIGTMLRRWGAVLVPLAVVVSAIVVPARPAHAAPLSFVVTKTADAPDANSGDGVCQATSGGCTLRAAIGEANENPGHDRVSFPPLSPSHHGEVITLTRPGSGEDATFTGDLDITDSVTIEGNGSRRTIVDGGGSTVSDRVIDIAPGGSGVLVELSGLTIRGGIAPGDGAGIRTRGQIRLTETRIVENAATRDGGGLAIDAPSGGAELADVTIRGNRAQRDSGGISNRGTLVLRDSSIDENRAAGGSGGLFNSGLATLSGVTVSGNRATGVGGGLFAGGILTSGSAILENVTVSGNTGAPGGLLNGGPTRLTNVTIAGNTGGIFNHVAAGGVVRTVNTIIADSSFVPGLRLNCYGTILSLGHNLEDGTSCGFTAAGDLQNTAAAMEPLAFSVGRTRTRAITVASPARDAGDPTFCPTVDQRHVARPQGTGCEIGAYELQVDDYLVNSPVDAEDAAPGDGVCQTTVSGQCTLRSAVMEANVHPGPDLILIQVSEHIQLTISGAGEDAARTGDLDVTDDLTIAGEGPTTTVIGLDPSLRDRVMHVLASRRPGIAVAMSGLAVQNGNPASGDEGGNVLVGDMLEPVPPRVVMRDVEVRAGTLGGSSRGGGVANYGDLEMTDTSVHDNRASWGGGVAGGIAATTTLTDVSISDNAATDLGGGIHLVPESTAHVIRTQIVRNTATWDGGGVGNFGTFHASEATVARNSAKAGGGGVYNGGLGSAEVTASSLSANTSANGGGALNLGTLIVTDSTIDGNEAAGQGGGGIKSNQGGSALLRNTTISGNTANISGGGISNAGTLTLDSVTLSGNNAAAGTSLTNITGTVTIGNSVLASTGGNCSGAVTSVGHNLDSGGTCSLSASADLTGVNPLLGPLTANGGPTATHALLASSPARDAGAAGADCPATDQRGIKRPQGPACDIGAYEATQN
jgi:CSLREA domain-containing protein